MAIVIKASSTNDPVAESIRKDGTRFNLAAPENLMLPEEKTREGFHDLWNESNLVNDIHIAFIRIIDAFVFLVQGQPEPLSKGWEGNHSWGNVHLVGAVANLAGSTTPFAQEVCFWLTTPLGDYAMLSPHKGYSVQWSTALQYLNPDTLVPTVPRMTPVEPIPSWWDPGWATQWPPKSPDFSTANMKRPATAMIESGEAVGLASRNSATKEGRRVRRKGESGGENLDDPLEYSDGKLSGGSSLSQRPQDVNAGLRCLPRPQVWDLVKDVDDRSRGGEKAKLAKR
ncbi:hypothetical protein RSAG8_03517, partial [Rhizoctonia solani AG-8 WAC10335]